MSQPVFSGRIVISPPLNPAEMRYLTKFATTRRMLREKGPYYVDGSGFRGQGRDGDVLDYNRKAEGQPSLWCPWIPTEDGAALECSKDTDFQEAAEWLQYLLNHFLETEPLAQRSYPKKFSFLQGHKLEVLGEAQGHTGSMVVLDNQTYVSYADVVESGLLPVSI